MVKASIEQSVRTAFPILFGSADLVDSTKYGEKDSVFSDSASAASAPYLTSETLRYQSMLLYNSLVLATIHAFDLRKFKFAENDLRIDKKLLLLYSLFLVLVGCLFLIKVYLDYKQALPKRKKEVYAANELSRLNALGFQRQLLQMDFWLRIRNAIVKSIQVYHSARAELLGTKDDYEFIEFPQLTEAELDKRRLIPELNAEIAELESKSSAILDGLNRDVQSFTDRASLLLHQMRRHRAGESEFAADNIISQLDSAYIRDLQPWRAAQLQLDGENYVVNFKNADPKRALAPLRDIIKTKEDIYTIRRLYPIVEVVAPVAFAILVLVYCWLFPAMQ